MRRRFVLVLLVTLAETSLAHAAPRYRLADLGFLPGGTAAAPRHFGPGHTVVGSCSGSASFGTRPTLWTLSNTAAVLSVTDLQGLPGSTSSTAFAMNASGWIAGFSNTASPQPRPVLWRGPDVIDLDRGGDGNANVYAFDVNDAGMLCGMITKSGGGGGWDACIWVERAGQPGRFDRSFLPLDPLGGLLGWTEAHDVLEDGRVFGHSNLGLNGDRATIWQNDATHTPVLLAPLAGSDQSWNGDINELGDAVGYSIYPFGLAGPTRWSRDAAHVPSALPMWPGDNSATADVISTAGDIVLGESSIIDTAPFPPVLVDRRSVLWADGGVFTLESRLDASGAGWTIESVADMNADGWIAAVGRFGGAPHAVVLVPVPDPLAVASAAATGVALSSPWPNPARGDARLTFTLPAEGEARLRIFDAQGRLVARLAEGRHSAGRHDAVWQGRDELGTPVDAGLYFATLEYGAVRRTARIVKVR